MWGLGGAGCIFYHTVTRSRDDTRDQLASPLRTCIAQTNFSSCPIDLFVRLESSQASVHLWKFIKHNHLTVNWRDRSTNDHWKEKKTQNLSNIQRNPILTFFNSSLYIPPPTLALCLFVSVKLCPAHSSTHPPSLTWRELDLVLSRGEIGSTAPTLLSHWPGEGRAEKRGWMLFKYKGSSTKLSLLVCELELAVWCSTTTYGAIRR